MLDLDHQVPEDSYYEPMEPESNFDEELARSELQRQTEELFSYIDLDPPEPESFDQIASPIAHDGSDAAQNPHVPADMLTDSTIPPSEQAIETSSSDTVPVEITSQPDIADTPPLGSSSGFKKLIVAPELPSQTHATVLTIAKPSITWNYTPPTTNPYFARVLAFNAKALNKPLPLVAQVPSEPAASTSFAAPVASPATVRSSTVNILSKPLVDEQASDAPVASSSPVSSPSFVHLPPLVDNAAVNTLLQLPQTELCDDISAPSTRSDQPSTRESTFIEVPISTSDVPASPATAPPLSTLLPVPPRVQRPINRLSLTELINKRREEHFRSHPVSGCINLTDDVSPSSGGSQAPSVSVSKPQESVQSPHITSSNASSFPVPVSARQPVPTVETRTPSIQEIRDLMRQRPSSSKLSISSIASNPSTSSAASATSALVPNISPPRSITSNSTSSSDSKPSSRRKSRSMGMASLEMFISPIPDESQPTPTKKTTPPTVKRTSYNADVFRRIITPTAEISVRSPSLSPSEGRRTRRVVRPSSPQGSGAGGDDDAASGDVSSPSARLQDQSHAPPELLEEPGVTSAASPFAIPVEEEIEVLETGVKTRRAHRGASPLDDVIDDVLRSEGLQGVTESIGSLDLHEHSRSPEVDINVNQVRGHFAFREYM
ncbi:hypothetical protein EDB19DRAFT_548425 [Suillus lakei]|nr:hypothetical protein EDB19DRAFT_548425 [Suillus lakei]